MAGCPAVYKPSGQPSPVRSARPSISPAPRGGPTDRTLRDLASRLPTPSPFVLRSARATKTEGFPGVTGARAGAEPCGPVETRAETSRSIVERRTDDAGPTSGEETTLRSPAEALPSHSSAPARAEPHRTRDASRGAAGSVETGTRSALLRAPPGVHARSGGQDREVGSVIGEEITGPKGAEPTAAPTPFPFPDLPGRPWPDEDEDDEEGKAPGLLYPGSPGTGLICSRCRRDIVRNYVIGISFCPSCGLSTGFLWWSQRRGAYVGV